MCVEIPHKTFLYTVFSTWTYYCYNHFCCYHFPTPARNTHTHTYTHTHIHTHTHTHTSFPLCRVSGSSSPRAPCSESINVCERVMSRCFYRHTTHTLSLTSPGELAMVKLFFTCHRILQRVNHSAGVWVECCVYCKHLMHGS